MVLNHRIIGQGPVLIVLHGLLGSLDNWMSIAKNLASHYTVCLVDLRNHGMSFHHSEFNYQCMSQDLTSLVTRLKFENYSILGHSMGGKVAMFHAASNSRHIHKLIIVDIAPKSYPLHHQHILNGLSALQPEILATRIQADNQLKPYIPEPSVRQFLLKNLKRNTNKSFEWKMNLPVIRAQISHVGEALPHNALVHSPTLFIRSGTSDYIGENDFEDIRRQFPSSKIQTIQNVGHWVHAEASAQFLNMVLKFLDEG